MLNLIEVENIEIEQLLKEEFDLGIFSSGYEDRSIALATKIDFNNISNILVLGFEEHSYVDSRIQNDKFYRQKNCEIVTISSQEELLIYSKLAEYFKKIGDKQFVRILIDYTSMSRLWYSGILNYLRFQSDRKIDVVLNYSFGVYENDFLDYSYKSINSLPSHEGTLSSNNKTLLVLAIGFSPFLVKSVIEEIEPNKIIGILPIPSIMPGYEKKSQMIKDDILTKEIDDWFRCPINNLEAIFRTYAEITNNNINDKDLIFLSLGPKIFTLASLLISQRFDQITCLYLKSTASKINNVKHSGDFVCSKITYRV